MHTRARCLAVAAVVAVVATSLPIPAAAGPLRAPASESSDGITITTIELDGARPGNIARVDFGRTGSSVAFEWTDPDLRFRFRSDDGAEWVAGTEEHAHGGDDHGESGTLETEHGEDGSTSTPALDPVWMGEETSAIDVEVLDGDSTGLEALLFTVDDAGDEAGAGLPDGRAGAQSLASASLAGSRTINPPESWGSSGWSYANCPNGPTYMDRVDFAVIHHTASGNSYSASQVDDQLRSIQAFHVRTRGWCDIAYNFMVDRFGQVWQGRAGDLFGAVQGGHAAGFNTGAVGISLLGDYSSTVPSNAMLAAAGDIAGWRLAQFGRLSTGTTPEISGGSAKWPAGQRVNVDRLTYHRNLQSTSCPGDQVISRRSVITAAAGRSNPSAFTYGRLGDVPLIGDWDGDRVETPTVRRNNVYYVRNSLTSGVAEFAFGYGKPTDIPLAGDWDGDGIDTLGVYRAGRFYLRNANTTGIAHLDFPLGRAGDVPIAGDWDGDGRDEVGVRRGQQVLWWNSDSPSGRDPSRPAVQYAYGHAADRPVIGDWDHDGIDTVSVRRGDNVFLNNDHFGGAASFDYLLDDRYYALFGHSHLGLPMPVASDGRHWSVGHPVVPG